MTPKFALVARHDLHMRLGKALVQGGHAVEDWLLERILANLDPAGVSTQQWTPLEVEYMNSLRRKIGLRVDSEDQLLTIHEQATNAGLNSHLITDAGLTEFAGPTKTIVGIGPNLAEDIDKITGKLKLL